MLKTSKIFKKCFRQFSSIAQNDVVIAAATRTPITSYLNTVDLIALTIDFVIKQASLPRVHIGSVYSVNSLKDELQCPLTLGDQLKKGTLCTNFPNDKQAILSAFENLVSGEQKAIIIAGISSCLPGIQQKNVLSHSTLIDDEVMPIVLRQKGKPMLHITKDEWPGQVEHPIYSTTALALMTAKQAELLNITPLALLRDVKYIPKDKGLLDIKSLLAGNEISFKNIKRWEILGTEHEISSRRKQIQEGGNSPHINEYGLSEFFSNFSSIDTALSLTHVVHTLEAKVLGCVFSNNTSLLVEKISNNTGNLPILTLYTKDPCPLCDELVKELQENFRDEYRLDKVFIDRKENIRFLRLYRFDIPVVFLNGQFLCMHRLNKELLRRKINYFRQLNN